MRAIFGLFFAFFLSVFANAKEIQIATYNVENLFDCKDDGSEYRDFRVMHGEWNCKLAYEKILRIKDVILSLDADIIALQEVENEQILKQLIQNTNYRYATFSGGKGAPVGLGLISKIRPLKTQNFIVPNVKTRNILKVEFEIEGKKFSVFVNHFPAYKNGLSVQQKAQRTLRNALENEKNAIVLGDFNTPFGSRSLLNDIIATRGYVDLWEFLKAGQRYSHARGGKKSAIDHVLLSPEFIKNGELSYVFDSFEVFKPAFMLDESGFTKRLNGKNLYSDHFPLRFRISTQPSWENSSFFDQIFSSKSKPDIQKQDSKKETSLKPELRLSNIDEIFATPENTPFFLSRAVVVYKDKNGFVLAQNHRGIYVFDPKNDLEIGRMLDVVITETKIYKDNLEVAKYEKKRLWQLVEPTKFMLPASRLNEARAGDVIDKISGQIQGGYLHTAYGKIRVYNPKFRLFDAKHATFERVRVTSYKGQKQILAEQQ